jgi:adenylyltransferase/sulfurtransferase
VDDRYSRQILFNGIGEDGQRRLLAARVLIVGCGALGSAHSESLARAGAGHLRIVDRDFVEPSNLQRQTMFTESDAEQRLPKAIAAANHLAQINSEIEIEPHILDINHSNIERLIDGEAQGKLDLRRRGWFVRRDDDDPSAPNSLPALRV